MSTSNFITEQYASSSFVESAGGVLFNLSTHQIGILHHLAKNEYLLPKGRRNCNESRREAAVREITEETGYPCRLLPVTMSTRTPPTIETEQLSDEARVYADVCEPFNLQIRHLGPGDVKLIWWYIAAVDDEGNQRRRIEQTKHDEGLFAVEFHDYATVLEKLTFSLDRDMVRRAIEIVTATSSVTAE